MDRSYRFFRLYPLAGRRDERFARLKPSKTMHRDEAVEPILNHKNKTLSRQKELIAVSIVLFFLILRFFSESDRCTRRDKTVTRFEALSMCPSKAWAVTFQSRSHGAGGAAWRELRLKLYSS